MKDEDGKAEIKGCDFFVSYNRADRTWAEWIAWHLEEAGYTVVIQAWDFRPGSNFVIDMQRAASTATRTIAVLSPDYTASRFTQPEWTAAFAQDPTGEKGKLLPIRVREVDLTGLLPQIVYIDLVGLDDATAQTTLLAGIQRSRAKPAIAPSFPGTHIHRDQDQPQLPTPVPDEQFRRIYYESFDAQHLTAQEIEQRFGNIWLIGQRGFWAGNVADGVYVLHNLAGPDAALKSRIRYFETGPTPIDLRDCKVSVKVRVLPPNDGHSGAGIMFRVTEEEHGYYAFFLNAGNNVSLTVTRADRLSFLWSQELATISPDGFTTLRMVGRGEKLELYVNDLHVYTYTDRELQAGSPGYIALSLGEFMFDDFAIYQRVSDQAQASVENARKQRKQPLTWTPELTRLRTVFATLYPDETSARRVVAQVGLNATMIGWSSHPTNNWHAILTEALKRTKLAALIEVALQEYRDNSDLLAAADAFYDLDTLPPLTSS